MKTKITLLLLVIGLIAGILNACKKDVTKELPTVTASTISNITPTSASSGGNVTADGGSTVTSRGVCWSTNQNPTTADSKTSDGTGTGSFSSSITGLTRGTTYNVRAYATNEVGTSYSSQSTFAALAIPADLTTSAVSGITATSVISGGSITNDGGGAITSRGVCWGTNQNPDINGNKTTDGSGSGSFISNITGLNPNTTYYIRAYATNSVTTAYGNQVTATSSTALATLTTTTVSNVISSSVTGGGNITSDGGTAVTARGVCWSTNQSPTISDAKTTDGSGTGSFTSSITSLNPGTIYYFRAYATNSMGTAYGNQVTVTTTAIQPTLTTASISSITATSAVSGGNISSDGGASVTARGVCWSTSQNPTTANSKTTDGTGTGSFTSSITGLTAGTTYYVRAYSTNNIGTSYGNQVTLTATPVLPSVTTSTISSITAISAIGGGNVVSDGGASVSARGICWGTTQGPTISGSKTTDGDGIGSFSSAISGLNGNTTYYVRAYATNSQGTSYGNEISFKTSIVLSLASLTTTIPSSITSNSAVLGGTVTSDGNSTVTERGICYSTSQNPTTSGNKVGVGNGIGSFSTTIASLASNTTYYVRAYAINNQGTAYGNEVSFKTNIVISLAAVITTIPSSVKSYSMVLGGNVTADGNATVTERGVYYSTTQYSLGTKYPIGSGTGLFSATVTGLSSKTTYYIKAYAINNQGTAYGEQLIVTTADLPVINTNTVSSYSSNSATTGGNVLNDNGAFITSRGVCWSTSQSPTISNNTLTNGTGIGGYTCIITGLTPNTTYYIRAYATNSNGTSYGNQVTFTTDPVTVTDIDGNSYNVIRIGTQLWMAQNLKTTTYNDGIAIPMVSGNSAWINLNTAAYCWYNNDPGNKNTYGALYNWWALESGKVCPTGWSVSSQDDWTTLDAFLDPNSGGKIKEVGTTHWNAPNTGATNETGFSALAGGYRSGEWNSGNGGFFGNMGYDGFYWTRDSKYTGSYSIPDFYIDLDDTSGTIWHINYAWQRKNYGLSVRCVKN